MLARRGKQTARGLPAAAAGEAGEAGAAGAARAAESAPSRGRAGPPARRTCPGAAPACSRPRRLLSAGEGNAERPRSPPAVPMERVRMINVQRLLEAAEFLERRDRGNGWAPPPPPLPPEPALSSECGAACEGREGGVCEDRSPCVRSGVSVRGEVRV